MDKKQRIGRTHGFSVIEPIIVSLLVLTAGALAFPSMQKMIIRSQLLSSTQEISALLHRARHESISRGMPVVVAFDIEKGEILAFADLHDADTGHFGSDRIYNPLAGAPQQATDYVVGRAKLEQPVSFGGPPSDPRAISGFSGASSAIVFHSDGSVEDAGAIRLVDKRQNFLEVRIALRATARIEIRKWTETGSERTSSFFTEGEAGTRWSWNL